MGNAYESKFRDKKQVDRQSEITQRKKHRNKCFERTISFLKISDLYHKIYNDQHEKHIHSSIYPTHILFPKRS